MQTQIPFQNTPQVHRTCDWCGAPAIGEITLEPERYRYIVKGTKRVKILGKRAIMAGVCGEHKNILNYQPTKEKPDNYRVKK